jgi:hypothetical protein
MSDRPTLEMSRYCVPFTPFTGKIEEATVMLVSTAGVYHKDDPPFRVEGDDTYRAIPGDAPAADLRIADAHYDHACVDKDINCVFPVDRLFELADERRIGGVAEKHFSMGFSQALKHLREHTIPRLVKEIDLIRPTVVLLTGG